MQLELYGKNILIYKKPVNFNKAIDGLSALISLNLSADPQKDIYLFFNKKKDKIKLLSYHKNGFVLFYKRLDKDKFKFDFNFESGTIELSLDELNWLLAGLEWQKMNQWKELNYEKFA